MEQRSNKLALARSCSCGVARGLRKAPLSLSLAHWERDVPLTAIERTRTTARFAPGGTYSTRVPFMLYVKGLFCCFFFFATGCACVYEMGARGY